VEGGVVLPALSWRLTPATLRVMWPFCKETRHPKIANISSELFPPDFPSELRVSAFRADNEAAWPPVLAVAAVEWFGTHGYGVLGTELWLLKDVGIQSLPMGLSGMREVHGNTVNRGNQESWSSFVARAAAETRTYLQAFKPTDVLEQGRLVFNVTWVSEAEFKDLERIRSNF
jgi:hypothetical protein